MEEIDEVIFKEKLGDNIRNARRSLHLTQETAAEKSMISTDFLSRIELGCSSPTSLKLVQISNALKLTPNDLLEEFIYNKEKITEDTLLREINELTKEDKEIILQLVKYILFIRGN